MFSFSTYILSSITVLCLTLGYFYYKYRIANRLKAPPNVVLLYQVGRGPKAPSFSPFPMKLETFLRMMNIPYMSDHSARFSSKGKTPWMELNGVKVTDSQLCIEYLSDKLNIDASQHLTKEQNAIARAFQKMTEENLYWTMCIEMFGDNLEPVKTVIPYRGFKLWMTVKLLRWAISKETWGHGIGRHSYDDVWKIAKKDMDALSHFLGDKNYMMGDLASEADCAIFGMLAQILWHMPGSRHEVYITESCSNLVAYCNRMKEKYWPDWDSVTLQGSSYVSDHGKTYNTDHQGLNGCEKQN